MTHKITMRSSRGGQPKEAVSAPAHVDVPDALERIAELEERIVALEAEAEARSSPEAYAALLDLASAPL